MSGRIDDCRYKRYNNDVRMHIYFYEVNDVQNGFLRRRIGLLMCMIGLVMIFAAVSYSELDKIHTVSADTSAQYTLIIDPGHGGDDGGAVSADGVQEADINLAIGNRLCAVSELCGIKTVMTRSTEEIAYPDGADTIAARKVADQKQRVARINATPNAVLISIHQNQYPTPQPHGAQVLYAPTADSAAFGELMHDMLVTNLDPANRRVAAPISDDIYLMKNIACPGVLVECGFLSNPDELARLQTDAYQIQLSMAMLSSYLQYFQNGCHI